MAFIRGTRGDDSLNGTDFRDLIFGRGGNDEINGGGGNDILIAGRGDDIVDGGDGNDLISAGRGDDTVFGGDGNDFIFAGSGNDFVDGGDGDDFVNAGSGSDTVFGGDGDDYIRAGSGDDFVEGGAGDDILSGGRGNDILFGDAGDDRIFGGGGRDFLQGDDGDDRLIGNGDADELEGGAGDDLLSGGRGDDILYAFSRAGEPPIGAEDSVDLAAEAEEVPANDDVDTLIGGSGADTFLFRWLIDAPADVTEMHTGPFGGVDYTPAGVAGENGEPHAHWVAHMGTQIVRDYNAEAGDALVFEGHDVTLESLVHEDYDDDGDLDTVLHFISEIHEIPGAHDGDDIGTVVVLNQTLEGIEINSDVFFGVADPFNVFVEQPVLF